MKIAVLIMVSTLCVLFLSCVEEVSPVEEDSSFYFLQNKGVMLEECNARDDGNLLLGLWQMERGRENFIKFGDDGRWLQLLQKRGRVYQTLEGDFRLYCGSCLEGGSCVLKLKSKGTETIDELLLTRHRLVINRELEEEQEITYLPLSCPLGSTTAKKSEISHIMVSRCIRLSGV